MRGCRFLGSNLTLEVLEKSYNLCVFDNLSRTGSVNNLLCLQSLAQFQFCRGDIRNADERHVLHVENMKFFILSELSI
jgi:dTDP-D-glucose 4,6-dehydratase